MSDKHTVALTVLRDALASFSCTQNPLDYPAEHWSRRAVALINAAQAAPAVPVAAQPQDSERIRTLEQKAFAFDEWIEKTDWVQEQISTFPIQALGQHRADVMRDEIARLRAAQAAPAVPEGWRLVPTDLNSVVNMGWVYLDKAREESPLKEWAFSPAGFIAAIAAAPSAPSVSASTARQDVIGMLLDVARIAYDAMDNTEDDGKGLHWNQLDFDALSAAMDKLEGLPDDRTGYVMGPAAKAEWALRAEAPVQQEPFGYFYELLDHEGKGKGVWLGCPSKSVLERAHIDGETGKEIVALYAAAPVAQQEPVAADRITTLRDVVMDAAEEWAQYVEADSAPRTCREHIALAFDAAIAAQSKAGAA